MLLPESVEKNKPIVKLAIDELFDAAYQNQKFENDLVLILANGTKTNYPEETLKRLKISNYQIGHDLVHFRYSTFFDFFTQYKRLRDGEEYDAIQDKQVYDETMVQMQLLAYMKFWETDLILKRLYNLSKLAQEEEFIWDIPQKELNERRRLVKDEIQNPVEELCPKFYDFIEDVYSRQLRNAIAHSQYYIMYDNITLTNKEENKYYKLNAISFERWDKIFTKVILMHNLMVDNFNKYHDLYVKKAESKHNGLRVIFPEKKESGLDRSAWIMFDKERGLWYWNNNSKR